MIDHRRDGDIHVVTLNNDTNTIDLAFVSRMHEVLDAIEAGCEGSAGMVLTGAGKFFCSGLNVEAVMSLEGADMAHFGTEMLRMMGRLVLLPIPTVAALNGHAFAGGAFLALGCDYRILRADRGWVCISEVDVGVPIGLPMMGLLKARVSAATARDAVLTGRRYAADAAIAAGLVDAKAAEADLVAEAKALATSMASKGRRIFGTLKKQLYAELGRGFGMDV